MTRTCGECAHTVRAGENVWCYGGPPTVTRIARTEGGDVTVESQRPLLPNAAKACALFELRKKVRAK